MGAGEGGLQNGPWVLVILIYDGVKVEIREDVFEPVIPDHPVLEPVTCRNFRDSSLYNKCF